GAVHSGKGGFGLCLIVTALTSLCRGPVGGLYAVAKRAGDRLPPESLARAQRARHRRIGRCRQSENGCTQRGQMGQPLRGVGATVGLAGTLASCCWSNCRSVKSKAQVLSLIA